MRRLVIIRHAKSSWEEYALPDFERPLSKRGRRDIPEMGKFLRKMAGAPDLFLSSPAVRAITTAKLLAEEISYPGDRIQILPEIYHADARALLDILSDADPGVKTVFLVGHNPSVTELANLLAECGISNIPTCGMASISFDLQNWADVRPLSGRMDFFQYPKNLDR